MRCGTVALILLFSLASAEIPQMMSYQGKVTDAASNPVADGAYAMQFRIYEVDVGGSPLWDSGPIPVTLVGGIFSVILGESPQPALGLQFQVDLWLEVVIEGDVQSPRQPLASVGYAYMASGLVAGTEVSGTVEGGSAFTGTNTATGAAVYGVSGQIESTEGSGVWGHAVSTTGDVCGVRGTSDSDDGVGVYGEGARGVYAVSTSTWGAGVYARTTATAGQTAGVRAWCGSPDGYGVHGEGYTGVQGWTITTTGCGVRGQAVATSGVADGIRGETASSSGRGVYGVNTATTGLAYGVYGLSSSTGGGAGVVGKAPEYGVIGEAQSTVDYSLGVWGFASNFAGRTFGVCGRSASVEGTGVWGWATASTGSTYGIKGESASTDGTGVSGVASATDGQTYGGWFRSASPSGRGVYGEAQDGFGIYGLGTIGVSGTTMYAGGTGVMGVAVETTGSSIGVFGQTSSPSGYGVYSSGNFAASGTKSCVVKTSQGPTLMYCQESPENWFEDFGEGQLMNGRCHVELDPLFLETATINDANPMKVFVTPDDPMCEGVAVVRSTTGFDVIELRGGECSSSFAYRVVAKRKGYESRRLDYCQAAEKDSYLFPKLREKDVGRVGSRQSAVRSPAR